MLCAGPQECGDRVRDVVFMGSMGLTLTDEDLDAIAVRVVKIMAARLCDAATDRPQLSFSVDFQLQPALVHDRLNDTKRMIFRWRRGFVSVLRRSQKLANLAHANGLPVWIKPCSR